MAPFRDRDYQQRCQYGAVEFIAGRGIFSFTPFNPEEAGYERMDINLACRRADSMAWVHQHVYFYIDGHWTKIGTIAEFFEFIERNNNIQIPVRSESYFNPDTNEQQIPAMQVRTIDVRILAEPFHHLRRIASYLFEDERARRYSNGEMWYPQGGFRHRITEPVITASQQRPEFEHLTTGFEDLRFETRIVKNRDIISKEAELKAELLLEKVIGKSKFNEWKKTGKFTHEGKFGTYEFSGNDVVLERVDKIGPNLEKKLWYRLCIQPKEKLPIADILASKVLLLKSDEEQFCKTSNFRSVSTKDEYTAITVPGGGMLGNLIDRITS